VDRDKNGALKGEIVQSFVLMGLMALVLGVYTGIAMLAVRAFG
jgi:hypothetical protein